MTISCVVWVGDKLVLRMFVGSLLNSTHSPVEVYLGCFWFGAICIKTALNINKHLRTHVFIFGGKYL